MAYSDVAQVAIDDVFAEFGVPATYNGGTTPITIIVDLRDGDSTPDDGRPIAGRIVIEVRITEVTAPKHNDQFAFGARTLRVMDRPWLDDESALVWKMWAINV